MRERWQDFTGSVGLQKSLADDHNLIQFSHVA